MGTAAGGSSVGKLFRNESSGRKVENNFLEIMTPDANYFPLLDIHTKIWNFADIPDMPKLNAVFYEFRMPQDKLLSLSPEEILNLQTSLGGEDVAVPDRERKYWRENETSIFLEGQMTPEISDLIAIGSELSGAVLGTFWFLRKTVGLSKDKKQDLPTENFPARGEVATKLGDALAVWGISPIASIMFAPLSILSDKQNDPRRSALDRTLDRMVGFSSDLHPENALVFFRNLNFARQLSLSARSEQGRNFNLPNIGYLVGSGHSGVGDFLALGDDVVYGLMEAYPRGFWEKFVERNGGVEVLCQTPIFDPDGERWKKRVVRDERFRRLLLRMLDEDRS